MLVRDPDRGSVRSSDLALPVVVVVLDIKCASEGLYATHFNSVLGGDKNDTRRTRLFCVLVVCLKIRKYLKTDFYKKY